MISYLEGVIKQKDTQSIILLVGGVGYRVSVPTNVLSQCMINESCQLYTHLSVKEDALDLYGFLAAADLSLYELIISVSGIGPKTGLAICSHAKREQIMSAIRTGNVEFFTGIPRLGKKNAQKLIIELKSKLGGISDIYLDGISVSQSTEVIDALKQFGFHPVEAREALEAIPDEIKDIPAQIRFALQYLGRRKK